MIEMLHAWALVPAVIGTCCLAADRRRVRSPDLAASMFMLVAMTAAAFSAVVPPVHWAALLLLTVTVLAALRGARRRAAQPAGSSMILHSTLGLVVMSVLVIPMAAGEHTASGT